MTSHNTLHIINKSTSHSALFEQCLDVLHPEDSIILIEDAVYACSDSEATALFSKNITVYALQADIQARQIDTTGQLTHRVNVIDDEEFVQLCTMHKKTMSWF